MRRTTDFVGEFDINLALSQLQIDYLIEFSRTRRMRRDAQIASNMSDSVRINVGLPIGKEACYFTGGLGMHGQVNDVSIMDQNSSPLDQPGLWCQWIPSVDGISLKWNGVEKFYNYVEWLEYIIKHFLIPWDRVLSGQVRWLVVKDCDSGIIYIRDNEVKSVRDVVTNTSPW